MLENLDKEYCFSSKKCAFYSRPDEQRVLSFCKGHSEDGFDALGWVQLNIREKECRLRIRRRQQKVVNEFRPLRPLPGDLRAWLGRNIMPAYFYYDAKKRHEESSGRLQRLRPGERAGGRAPQRQGCVPLLRAGTHNEIQQKAWPSL